MRYRQVSQEPITYDIERIKQTSFLLRQLEKLIERLLIYYDRRRLRGIIVDMLYRRR